MPHLELISFKLCPFVQRSVITLLHKSIPFEITYIELNDPPLWFTEISPLGKVPVLRVDHDIVLFESAIINEYADEITPGTLLPKDPLHRARSRAWIYFGEQCLFDQYHWLTAKTLSIWEDTKTLAKRNLARLEQAMDAHGPYFNGEEFTLIDAAYAPLFMRYELLRKQENPLSAEEYPHLTYWSESLLSRTDVSRSVVDDFPCIYQDYLGHQDGYAATNSAFKKFTQVGN